MKASDGFSLLEVLVAATILAIGASALAQLFVISTSANRSARTTTFATLFAQQKMEQLRVSGLTASPPGSLAQNTPGYCEFLDASGGPRAANTGAVYTRRWAVEPLPAGSGALVLEVLVTAGQNRVATHLVGVSTQTALR